MFVKFILLLLFCLPVHHCSKDKEKDKEMSNFIRELRKELFHSRDYDIMARPVRNYTHPVNVSLYFDLTYINYLDIETHVLESEGWVRLTWQDEFLAWNPDEFGGIEDIRVTVDEVFRPDITIINSVGSENLLRTSTHSDMVLWNTGDLFWMPAISMRTICNLDLSEWPFDQHVCTYSFGSWTYDGNALNLINATDQIEMSSFNENPEWEPVASKCEYKTHTYSETFFPEVIFSITLKRKTTVYRYVVYFPILCALFLNLMTFFIDVRNHLRFYLSTVCFFTLLLYLLYLGSRIGFGSMGTPNVLRYLSQMVVLTSVTLVWFAFSISFIDSTFEVPQMVMRGIEPIQQWLVRPDVESEQLTELDPENPAKPKSTINPTSNRIFVQVIDKILLVLFFILMIVLHN